VLDAEQPAGTVEVDQHHIDPCRRRVAEAVATAAT
jgi:hypothetical protein